MKLLKGQSAMEYIMTYGWAILIIAIVLVALFELGIFGGSTLPTSCVAQSGFICQNPVYVGQNIIVTIGQSSGQSYTNANVYFLNTSNLAKFQQTSTLAELTALGVTANQIVTGSTSMVSGSTYSVTVPTDGSGTPTVGSAISGQLWLTYTNAGTQQYAELALVTAKQT